FMGTDPGKLWEVNLDNGFQTIISSNNSAQGFNFDHPVDIAVDAGGTIYVVNTGGPANDVAGSLFRVNPNTGVQALITPTFGQLSGTNSVEVGTNGRIFVGQIAGGSNPATVLSVNPSNGAFTTLTSNNQLSLVEGMRIFRAPAQQPSTSTTV